MPASAPVWIKFGTPDYRRTGLALFLAGFATFALLYCVQPLLPLFAEDFGVTPAGSSLALSLSTGTLAFSVAAAGAFSQAIGRRGLMFASMLLAGLFNLVAALISDWHALLAARALEGLVLGGLPAVAMAYLGEEIEPSHLGRSMGLYVAGTAFGGMTGRIGMGVLTEVVSWRVAMSIVTVLCLASAVGFRYLLPVSRNFVRRPGLRLAFHFRIFGWHLRTGGLLRIYGSAFVSMSVFVTLYNYMTFRLSEAPYLLGQGVISTIFLAYGFGVASSWMGGALADRFGSRPLLIVSFALILAGIAVTIAQPLTLIVCGLVVMTIGFFIVHAVNSASVGPLAGDAKAHASALYLVFYYLGSSISGTAGGWFWQQSGWLGVAGFAAACASIGLVLAVGAPPLPSRDHLPSRAN